MQNEKKQESNELILIPKAERYIQYMIEVIIKLPRTEKFGIGTEYKKSMFKMLEKILIINKVNMQDRLNHINYVDAELNVQRIYLRIMCKNMWIDKKKFDYSMELIYEMGKIIGGLTKYYAKNYKKQV